MEDVQKHRDHHNDNHITGNPQDLTGDQVYQKLHCCCNLELMIYNYREGIKHMSKYKKETVANQRDVITHPKSSHATIEAPEVSIAECEMILY